MPCDPYTCGKPYVEGENTQDEHEGSSDDGQEGTSDELFDGEPPPLSFAHRFDFLKIIALRICTNANQFRKNVYNDPFGFQVIKSTVYFTMGLKLFNDLAHALVPKKCGSQL